MGEIEGLALRTLNYILGTKEDDEKASKLWEKDVERRANERVDKQLAQEKEERKQREAERQERKAKEREEEDARVREEVARRLREDARQRRTRGGGRGMRGGRGFEGRFEWRISLGQEAVEPLHGSVEGERA